MKKNDIILIVVLIGVVVLGFFLMKGEKYEPDYDLPLTLSGKAGLQELTYDEYQEKIDNDDSFVVIIERKTCTYCEQYMPIAEDFALDEGLPLYYIDTDTFSNEEHNKLAKSISYFNGKNGNWGTPTTVVQAGFDTVDYAEGLIDEDKLLELYEDNFDME